MYQMMNNIEHLSMFYLLSLFIPIFKLFKIFVIYFSSYKNFCNFSSQLVVSFLYILYASVFPQNRILNFSPVSGLFVHFVNKVLKEQTFLFFMKSNLSFFFIFFIVQAFCPTKYLTQTPKIFLLFFKNLIFSDVKFRSMNHQIIFCIGHKVGVDSYPLFRLTYVAQYKVSCFVFS